MVSYESILRAFHDKNLRYLIVGGVAVNLHGYPRFTNDIDILLALDHDNLAIMAEIVQSMGYQQRLPISIQELGDTDKVRTLMKEKGLVAYSFIHAKEPQFNIDVLVAESLKFETFTSRKMNAEVWGLKIPVVSIDDLINMKQHSDREGYTRRRCPPRIKRLMNQKSRRTSGFDREHLRLLKYASVESKFHALTAMIEFAQEAQRSCKKRGANYRPAFSE